MRAWADDLEEMIKRQVKFVFANPGRHQTLSWASSTHLARSMKKRAGDVEGRALSLARNFEQLVELGKHGHSRRQRPARRPHRRLAMAIRVRATRVRHPRRTAARRRHRPLPHRRRAAPGVRDPVSPCSIAMTSRIKLLARMEIVEKRRPQDGRIKTVSPEGDEVELRISTMPTAFGEKLVMRIFTPDVRRPRLRGPGLHARRHVNAGMQMIKNPNGIILVTGPTGSGKTTTLYSTLKHARQCRRSTSARSRTRSK